MSSKLKIIQRLREETDTVLLALSLGKDSLACLELLHHFNFTVKPYYMYAVPNLGFIERYLQGLEKRYGFTVAQYPNPAFGHEMRGGWYRTEIKGFPTFTFAELRDVVRHDLQAQWIVEGFKKQDSLERRAMIKETVNLWGPENEGLNFKRKAAWPIADWVDHDVYAYLNRQRIPLPPDYSAMGSGNWGGALGTGWLIWIYENYPEDFKILERYYPHLKAAMLRDVSHRKSRR